MTRAQLVGGAVSAVIGLVAVVWFVPRVTRSMGDSIHGVTGRADLRILEREGILAFRAPGTTLRSTVKQPASSGPLGLRPVATIVEQIFVVDGDSLAALEAYRATAQADGWGLVGPWCSRYHRDAAYLFGKSAPIRASLTVRVVLPGTTTAPGLTVTLTAANLAEPGSAGRPLPAGDIACLRSVNSDDPAFQARPGPGRTSADLCALLPVASVSAIVPEVTVAVPKAADQQDRATCDYEQRPYMPASTVLKVQGMKDSLLRFSVTDAAAHPRVMYEERQLPTASAEGDTFLLASDVRRLGPPVGVWVDTRTGPLEVTTPFDGLDGQQLVAIAALLRG